MNKNHGIVRYLEFMVARDGDADLLRRRLSKREAFFDALARSPVSSYALIDRATYFPNMARRRPESGLEPRMLWILATAKANQAERFGVGALGTNPQTRRAWYAAQAADAELDQSEAADYPKIAFDGEGDYLKLPIQFPGQTLVIRNEAFPPQIKVSYDLLDSEVRSAAFVHRSDKAASSANPKRLGR
jgi:hypothetical protein